MNFRHYRLSPHPALCLVAIGCIAAVTYGSFVPLNYVPLSFAETLDRAQEMPWLSISIERRADWVANGALFFPCAVLLSAALSLDRGSVGRAMAALLACTFLSTLAIAIEFAQHWFPGRTISKNDILSEAIGIWAGGLAWACFAPDMCRKINAVRHNQGGELLVDLAQICIASVIAYGLFPLDFVLSLSELDTKIAMGRVAWGWMDAKAMALAVVTFIPIGLSVHVLKPTFLSAMVCAFALATLYELIQIPVFSRTAAASHGLAAFFGAALGVGLGRSGVLWEKLKERRLPLAFTLTYLSLVTLIYWYPFNVATSQDWAERLHQIYRAPFSAHYIASEFNTLNNIVVRTALFGLGGAMTYLTRKISISTVALLVLWPTATELIQVVLEAKVADLSDAAIGSIAALTGAGAARFIHDRLTAY
jgi:VanZ family protein